MSSINTVTKTDKPVRMEDDRRGDGQARPPVSLETKAHSARAGEGRARKVASTLSSMGEQMNDQESTSSIAELKTQKAALCLEMESATQAFVKATQTFAEGEIRRSVEQAVTSQYELSRRLGGEGLRPLKVELDQLISDRSPEAIQSRLNHDGLWPHRSDNFNHPNVAYSHYRTSTVSPLPQELSRAIGEILKQTAEVLLKQHGFAFVPSGHVQSEEMMAAFRRYSELYFHGAECARDLQRAEIEEGKAEAKRLWDAA